LTTILIIISWGPTEYQYNYFSALSEYNRKIEENPELEDVEDYYGTSE